MNTTTMTSLWNPAEVVPLADRLRYMRVFRAALITAVIAFGLLAPQVLGTGVGQLAPGILLYAAISMVAEGLWGLWGRRALRLFGAMLLLDGVYLAWITYMTGGTTSPLRYLILLHLIVVTLLASYRTGLKLALWHSLLVFVVFYAERAKVFAEVRGAVSGRGSPFAQVSVFVAVLWLVALAIATCSAVNERELRRRRFDLEALAKMAAKLETARDSASVAEFVLAHICETFDVQRAVMLAAPEGDYYLVAARGVDPAVASGWGPFGPDSVVERSRTSRETLLLMDLDAAADPQLAALLPGAQRLVVLPLSAEGRSIGVLVVEHSHRDGSRIERRAVSTLEQFASYAGLALHSAWLSERVQRLADTDGLTSIANRRTFEIVLAREVFRAAHRGESVSLVMVDIDHFKGLNDRYGHQTGDEVLRQIGSILVQSCRDIDTPARYGGEEFALILPGCPPIEALATAERVRATVAEANSLVPITVSVGVATFPDQGDSGAALVKAADDALYASKRDGRNRVSGPDPRGARRPIQLPVPDRAPEAVGT